MKKEIGVIRGIVTTQCPRCREANMFQYSTLNLGKMLKMHKECPKCHQDFMPEPGFYFGAMYFSYAFNVAIMVVFGLGYEILFNPDNIVVTLLSVFIPAILFSPWNFRISRALMLYAFGGITYQKKEDYSSGKGEEAVNSST